MTQEQPLIKWKVIGKHIDLSAKGARQYFKREKIPIFWVGRYPAIYPSDLKRYQKAHSKPI